MFDLYPHKKSPLAPAANLAYALVECKFNEKTPAEVFVSDEHLEMYRRLAASWPRVPPALIAGFEQALERYREHFVRNHRSFFDPAELAEEVCAWALAIVHFARAIAPNMPKRAAPTTTQSGVVPLPRAELTATPAAASRPKR